MISKENPHRNGCDATFWYVTDPDGMKPLQWVTRGQVRPLQEGSGMILTPSNATTLLDALRAVSDVQWNIVGQFQEDTTEDEYEDTMRMINGAVQWLGRIHYQMGYQLGWYP